jgi:hypothetical protein
MKHMMGLMGLLLATAAIAADPPPLSPAAEAQRQQAADYTVGATTWKEFLADGWATRSPGNGDLGILRLDMAL